MTMRLTRAHHAKLAFVLALTATAMAPATSAPASTGGVQGPSTSEGASGGAAPDMAGGSPVLSASPYTLLGRTISFRGQLGTEGAGKTVTIEITNPRGKTVARLSATADRQGAYSAGWRTNHIGRFSVRVHRGDAQARASSTPTVSLITVYRPTLATWYGPGSYGQRTACGVRLTPHTLGVAHRTLPCGTLVEFAFGHRRISVPVIDRGPFTAATWDLTGATAHALGFDGRTTIGALALGRPAAAHSR
jgi:hypothetical protein